MILVLYVYQLLKFSQSSSDNNNIYRIIGYNIYEKYEFKRNNLAKLIKNSAL